MDTNSTILLMGLMHIIAIVFIAFRSNNKNERQSLNKEIGELVVRSVNLERRVAMLEMLEMLEKNGHSRMN